MTPASVSYQLVKLKPKDKSEAYIQNNGTQFKSFVIENAIVFWQANIQSKGSN